jgi:hypothetical protein
MFGNHLQMTPLSARKRLLLAESELNRAQLTRDVHVLTTGVRALTERTKTIRSVAVSTAGLIAGLAAFQRDKPLAPSRMQVALKAAGFIASFWLACRSRGSGDTRER